MTRPARIQRKRVKGFDLQAESRAINGRDCVYVGRPTKWGNRYKAGKRDFRTSGILDYSTAVERFAERLVTGRMPFSASDIRAELRGRNLACWCPLDQPCHADVLLEIANGENRE